MHAEVRRRWIEIDARIPIAVRDRRPAIPTATDLREADDAEPVEQFQDVIDAQLLLVQPENVERLLEGAAPETHRVDSAQHIEVPTPFRRDLMDLVIEL